MLPAKTFDSLRHVTKTFRIQRLANGWTLEDLAQRCREHGVYATNSNLSKIERDIWGPSPPLRAVLCSLLDLPITYFDREERECRRQREEAA